MTLPQHVQIRGAGFHAANVAVLADGPQAIAAVGLIDHQRPTESESALLYSNLKIRLLTIYYWRALHGMILSDIRRLHAIMSPDECLSVLC